MQQYAIKMYIQHSGDGTLKGAMKFYGCTIMYLFLIQAIHVHKVNGNRTTVWKPYRGKLYT